MYLIYLKILLIKNGKKMKTQIKTNKVITIIMILLLQQSTTLFATDVRGKVSGKNTNSKVVPLPNSNIQIMGTNKGTLTNHDGYFELTIDKPTKIIVSYIGYKKDTLELKPGTNYYEVVLNQELTTLNTVEVTGQKPEGMIDQSNIVKTEVITSQGLLKAACCNLSESFQTNPSVDVTFTDAVTGAKQIQLLGLAQIYTQLLTEKTPNLQGIASNYGLNYIPGPWMNSISISKGAASVTTGYESITGQINVDYKDPFTTDKMYFNIYANDIQKFEGSFVGKYQISDKVSTATFLHGNTLNQNIDLNKDGFSDVPKGTQVNLMERLSYMGSNYVSKTIFQALYDDKQAGQIGYLNGSNPTDWGANIKVNRYFFSTKNGYVFPSDKYMSLGTILSFIHHTQTSNFGLTNYNAEQNSVYLNLLWQSSFDTPVKHLPSDEMSADAEMAESAKHNYTLGFSYSYNNYLQLLNNSTYNSFESVPGFFFEYSYSGIKNFVTTLGLREDFHNIYGNLFTPRLHLQYKIGDYNTIRASIGKGYHNPLPIAENQNILSSSRKIFFNEPLKNEEAWNYGINSTHELDLFSHYATLNLEYYRTDFVNQTIVDLDSKPGEVHFYNLKGKSFSNSFQIDFNIEITKEFNATAAYRLNDVWITTDNTLQQKPLISPNKFFINLAYSTGQNGWGLDFTAEYNGGGRMPSTAQNPPEYRLNNTFPGYFVLYGQITKRFGNFEVYLGGENLTNFKQPNPILASDSPFSQYFDGSLIWGPIEGRKIYLGARFTVN